MDSQTRHALKQDKFVQATQSSVSWVETNRSSVIRLSVIGVLILAVLIAGAVFYNQRSRAAEGALGSALDVYSAPLAQPGAPTEKDVYATAAERSKAANQQFVQVASQYGWLPEGGRAHYFAGLTYQELGQTASAESELKIAADSWNSDLSTLAKFALAGFYHQTGRDAQAIDLYNAVAAKPSATVPAYTAQLALADLYASTGKVDQAKQLWAKIKDADKTGSAGAIAAGKLSAKK
ncbi:YfgM family protein [Acidicapsa ligni]|uniref:coatomer subunit epsilon n=1 Tax=Acidicapsa ligni TaxID=542300 RepID=UPI0021E0A8A9|nr:coatomer subunit epsilon [Acidicapsa ligni]